MTLTETALLWAILRDPSDDLPRLAYADWLEENGEDQRAEYIRDGIAVCFPERLNPDHDMGANWDGVIDIMSQYPPDPAHCPLCQTIARLRVSPVPRMLASELGSLVGMPADWSGRRNTGANHLGVRCRRGFVSEIRVPLIPWLKHGRQIVRRHPVEKVTITDRRPSSGLLGRHWWHSADSQDLAGSSFVIGRAVWDYLPESGSIKGSSDWKGYASEALAKSALGHAALTLARRQANADEPGLNLPELEWRGE